MQISQIFNIENLAGYKLHIARRYLEGEAALDLFLRDKAEWAKMNSPAGVKEGNFKRRYIFSMMQFYPEGKDIWLFGGIFAVDGTDSVLTDFGKEFIGRLKIKLPTDAQIFSLCLENQWDKMTVHELLAEPYSGEVFPGYDNISLNFPMLETIIKNQPADWKTALHNVKGIYCIADKSNGRKYIGSAYGEMGLWSRWACYAETGHGHNKQLRALIDEVGLGHARENFRFTLLELYAFKTGDDYIISRENFWKEALLTRKKHGEHGYNAN